MRLHSIPISIFMRRRRITLGQNIIQHESPEINLVLVLLPCGDVNRHQSLCRSHVQLHKQSLPMHGRKPEAQPTCWYLKKVFVAPPLPSPSSLYEVGLNRKATPRKPVVSPRNQQKTTGFWPHSENRGWGFWWQLHLRSWVGPNLCVAALTATLSQVLGGIYPAHGGGSGSTSTSDRVSDGGSHSTTQARQNMCCCCAQTHKQAVIKQSPRNTKI